MNDELDSNLTLLYNNWTYYNNTLEPFVPRNNITYVGYYLHQPSTVAIFIVSYLLIFLVCMVGNGVVCFIVLRSKNMRTVTNLFILNLAVSDLLVGIFCMPTTLLDNIITGWPFGSLVCKMSGMVQGISVSASVFTLVAIAVDRFRCIVYPFKQKLTISTATLIIVVIWALAISIMCPSGVMLQVTKEQTIQVLLGYDNKTTPFYWCRENWPNQEMRRIYTTVLFANIYLAPLSLIVIMYARIGITLFKTTVPSAGKPGQNNRYTISKKKQRVIKMLLIVALLFILSWLPLWTLMMLSDYASLTEQQYKIINIYIYPFAHWLAFFNSSVNPIIYGFFNENFRSGFQAVFKFRQCAVDGQQQKTYSQRQQGNTVLPANNVPSSLEPISLNSMDKSSSRRNNHVNEQDLVMEDLDKASGSSGGITAVSI
ncbi:neuropeptide FF receptor 2a [Cynoglossus semilaevis]|uniref:Neuropeptide FF receptor 2 n=1 Tax=Cynoglossus semilaevis TaxID=244447 RepID=A0A3P8WUC8_CYNSE|nr:neuropeptide FF receptor 2-like [Cynoglossus semilaevis]WLG17318.1 neuropeptide FF receptor 2-2 [Cynoglossus semilaevis]